MPSRGQLIVFEGIDGAGTTTQSHRFHHFLMDHFGAPATLLTAEPHPLAAAGLFIAGALKGDIQVDPDLLALAFALNRLDHCARWIRPAWVENRLIVSDRYLPSSLVYQPMESTLTFDDVWELNKKAMAANLTFFLKVDPQVALDRIKQRGKPIERYEGRLQEAAGRYDDVMAALREFGNEVVEIDANQPVEAVGFRVLVEWKSYVERIGGL